MKKEVLNQNCFAKWYRALIPALEAETGRQTPGASSLARQPSLGPSDRDYLKNQVDSS